MANTRTEIWCTGEFLEDLFAKEGTEAYSVLACIYTDDQCKSKNHPSMFDFKFTVSCQLFVDAKNPRYRDVNFNIPNNEEGGPADRPLIVQVRHIELHMFSPLIMLQFCANDPDLLLQAAKIVEPHCDAVDINFGCPQDIARRGRYGCFLQDDWDLVFRLSKCLITLS